MSLFGGVTRKKAVAYYRHSAEDKQENSVPIQREQVQRFADRHSIDIIHEEVDEGKSGLTAGRPGFQRLFDEWVLNPEAPVFDFVLVLDVSRWGRFQDQDESAHYQFLCKKHGRPVVYLSRGLPKPDESPMAQMENPFHRIMAGQYSAELSDKVSKGCIRTSQQGYSNGGIACFGLARFLLDIDKKPVRVLRKGEHKCIANERVVFVPADDGTTQTVQDIFQYFVTRRLGLDRIVGMLNASEVRSPNGGTWNKTKIIRILMNEVYTGTLVYNKTWNKLKKGHRKNPRSEWIKTENAIPAIIDKQTFELAQERLYWILPSRCKAGERAIRKARKSVLKELRSYLVRKGLDSAEAIRFARMIPVLYAARTVGPDNIGRWCFLIKEHQRWFDRVLAVAVDTTGAEQVEKFFMLPTSAFAPTGYIVISDPLSSSYRVGPNEIENEVESLFVAVLQCAHV
ncbi:MAG: recombinase family protein [Patescibacteria group bacterium]|nr:MAG: recombinase family protein [Patescibacteria group bacterium]